MTDVTLLLITMGIVIAIGIGLIIAIIIDTLWIIRERILMFLEKYFPKYYYYDYEDERRK